MLHNPNASVSEAMTAVQVFSRTECANCSFQQRVRQAHKKQCAANVLESVGNNNKKQCAVNVPELVGNNNAQSLSSITNPSFQTGSTNNNNGNCNKDINSINTIYNNIDTEVASMLLQLSSVSSGISTEGSKTQNKRNSSSLEGVKEIRSNSSQAQHHKVNNQK